MLFTRTVSPAAMARKLEMAIVMITMMLLRCSKMIRLVFLDDKIVGSNLTNSELFHRIFQVDSCKKCYYDEETDTGDRKCGSGDVDSVECPSYSRSSCYAVANWHQVRKIFESDFLIG